MDMHYAWYVFHENILDRSYCAVQNSYTDRIIAKCKFIVNFLQL